ncbi:MAG: RNA-directed DNA polymerase [Methylobacillus sp.]|jgi:retron-type reverse transcriptase|nr:RNA-directed DNA polymerase [Methylobacillus sp.]
MATLIQLRNKDNLRRAWRWIQSNADASYKSYFRSLYQDYAVAEDALLDDLADRLRRGIYEPSSATKIYFPKASGILRPYSLLNIDDQIVYQAAVNLIAERMSPKMRQRYNKTVFGHLYAGKSSVWFYRKWSEGYKAFNDATREAFNEGLTYTASFDLTACYDSLDHGVLSHFLSKLGFDNDFCVALTSWLAKWTATERGIFHNHGIPQGPMSSGLLSEVVLSYFDDLGRKQKNFRYLRYVDDIRLFAKDELTLRQHLVALDHRSKDIGLFPQSSKISIHKISDVEKELKSISNPSEPSIRRNAVNQKRLLKRIVELTPRYKIENATRFKYLLAHAEPNAILTARLWKILDKHPEIYKNVCNYLRRYNKLPRVAAKAVVVTIKGINLYQSVRAEFISAVDGRLPNLLDRELAQFLKKLWHPKTMKADELVAIGCYLMRVGMLSSGQIRYACKAAPSWWARAKMVEAAALPDPERNVLDEIVGNGILDKESVPALAAAWKGFSIGGLPSGTTRNWNRSAFLLLKEAGRLPRRSPKRCGIHHSLHRINKNVPELKWRRIFRQNYRYAERQIVEASAAMNINITNFVNLLDVFNDRLLVEVFRVDGGIGNYSLGRIGSALSASSRFATKYPATFAYVKELHAKRGESMASHPVVRSSGQPTGKISYKFLPKAKKLLIAALKELDRAGLGA